MKELKRQRAIYDKTVADKRADRLTRFIAHVQQGTGWISYDYIQDSWLHLFNEQLNEDEIESISDMLQEKGIEIRI